MNLCDLCQESDSSTVWSGISGILYPVQCSGVLSYGYELDWSPVGCKTLQCVRPGLQGYYLDTSCYAGADIIMLHCGLYMFD